MPTQPVGGLAEYFRNNVIGGPKSFVASDFEAFGEILANRAQSGTELSATSCTGIDCLKPPVGWLRCDAHTGHPGQPRVACQKSRVLSGRINSKSEPTEVARA
jgi:hypothetical protein